MSELNLALVAIGGTVLVLGLFSNSVRRSVLSEPLVALALGVLLSPAALGLLDVSGWGDRATILEQAARLTLAISLMGVALRLPPGYFRDNLRPMAAVLGLVMPLMWLSGGLLTYLILGLPFWVALLVGAVVTPTDPVVSSTIVTGDVAERNLPARLRHLLSGESGANDGLAYPFVFVPLLLLAHPPGEAAFHWLVHTLLWEVGVAVAFGALAGLGAGWALEWAEARGDVEQTSFLAYTLALSLAVLGLAKLLGSDGILAVFVAGLALNRMISQRERAEEERVQEAVNRFFVLPIFVLLGLALPWGGWWGLGWPGLLLAGAILLLRRLPAVLAAAPLVGLGRRDALFLGWFGPIGVAALFYANLSLREAGLEQVWVVGSLVICTSILAHGISAAPLTRLYGRSRT